MPPTWSPLVSADVTTPRMMDARPLSPSLCLGSRLQFVWSGCFAGNVCGTRYCELFCVSRWSQDLQLIVSCPVSHVPIFMIGLSLQSLKKSCSDIILSKWSLLNIVLVIKKLQGTWKKCPSKSRVGGLLRSIRFSSYPQSLELGLGTFWDFGHKLANYAVIRCCCCVDQMFWDHWIMLCRAWSCVGLAHLTNSQRWECQIV